MLSILHPTAKVFARFFTCFLRLIFRPFFKLNSSLDSSPFAQGSAIQQRGAIISSLGCRHLLSSIFFGPHTVPISRSATILNEMYARHTQLQKGGSFAWGGGQSLIWNFKSLNFNNWYAYELLSDFYIIFRQYILYKFFASAGRTLSVQIFESLSKRMEREACPLAFSQF